MQPKRINTDYFLPEEGSRVPGETILQLSYMAPPTTYSHGIFQPGYPYCDGQGTGEPLYPTFNNTDAGWVYVGLKPEV